MSSHHGKVLETQPHGIGSCARSAEEQRANREFRELHPGTANETEAMKAGLMWAILGIGAVLAREDQRSGEIAWDKADARDQSPIPSHVQDHASRLPRHAVGDDPEASVQFQGDMLIYDREAKLPIEGSSLYYQMEPIMNGSMKLEGMFTMPLAENGYAALAFAREPGEKKGAPTFFVWVVGEEINAGHYVIMGSETLQLESIVAFTELSQPDMLADYSEGVAKLKFTYDPVSEKGENLLLAVGDIHEDTISGHSEAKNYFVEFDSAQASGHNTGLLVAHGWLMTISVGVLFPIGIIFPIAFKSVGPMWFQLHRAVQTVGFLAFTAGLGIGISDGHRSEILHLTLGIASFAFAVLQMTALFFRPGKDAPARRWWNFCHWASGYTCVGLGIADIYIGLTSMGALEVDDGYTIAYSVVLGVIISCLLGSKLYVVLHGEPSTMIKGEKESELQLGDKRAASDLPGGTP